MQSQKQYSVVVALLLAVAFSALPARLFAQARAGSAFLKILPGTRQQNMAGSLTAGLDENYSVFANPGAMGFLREWQLSASYNKWIADISYVSLFAGKDFHVRAPWGDRLYLALGFTRQGVDDFDATGGVERSVGAEDVMFSASVGLPLSKIYRRLSIGGTVKYLKTDLANLSDETVAFDLGAIVRTGRFRFPVLGSGILSAGASWNHLGESLKFISEETPLPRTFRAGLALNIGKHDGLQFQFAADYRKVRDEDGRVGIGGEIINLLGRYISVRAGYVFNDNQDTRLVSKFSMGLSVRFDDYMPLTPAPRNTAMRIDGGYLNSKTFSNVYQGSVTVRPIHPERFGFVVDSDHMSLDELPPPAAYDAYEPIELVWQASKDPELYDNVNYVIAIAKEDRSALAELIEDENIFEFTGDPIYSYPASGPGTVFYQPAAPGALVPEIDHSYIRKNKNHLSYEISRKFHDTQIDFVYFFPHDTGVEDKVGPMRQNAVTLVRKDATFFFDRQRNQFRYRLQDDLAQGVYFWTVVAYDKNHHVRYVKTDGSQIAQFRVFGRPDLTINLTKVVVDSLLPAKVIPLRNVTFPVDSASFASLPDTSRLNLENWLKTLGQGLEGALIEVAGHTDSTGPARGRDPLQFRNNYNQSLSLRRAGAIADRLQEYLVSIGFPADSIRVSGYGESELLPQLVGETRKEWLQRNRRVELRIRKRALTRKYFADIVVKNIGNAPVAGNFTVTVYDSLVDFRVTRQPAQLLEQITALQLVFESPNSNGQTYVGGRPIVIDTSYYAAKRFTVTGFDSLSNPVEIPGFITRRRPIHSLTGDGAVSDTAFYSVKEIQVEMYDFTGSGGVRPLIKNRIVDSKNILPRQVRADTVNLPLFASGTFRPEVLLKQVSDTRALVKANGVAADTSYQLRNDFTVVLYDPDNPKPQLHPDDWAANEPILSANAPDVSMRFDKVQEVWTPDTTFRFDLLASPLKVRYAEKRMTVLVPGESDTVRIAWLNDKPIMAAVVDVENYVSEVNLYNNWDIDGLNLHDLKIDKKAIVTPLRPEIRFNKVGSFKLGAAARSELKRLSRSFNSDHFKNLCIQIEGHTDMQGWRSVRDSTENSDRNMRLSLQRIESVRSFLVSTCDIAPQRIAVKPYGQTRPLVPNAATPAEHLTNRRVEIFLLKKNCPGDTTCSAVTCEQDTINAINLGDAFSYEIRVINQGQFTARDFVVTDVIPVWVTVDEISPTPIDTVVGGGLRRITWRFNSLAPQAAETIRYRARVNSVPSSLTVLTNVATVSSQYDSRAENNSDSDSVFVVGGQRVQQTGGSGFRGAAVVTPPDVASPPTRPLGSGTGGSSQAPDLVSNRRPVARGLKIVGEPRVDSKLSAVYHYYDAEQDPRGEAIFQWRRNGTIITGATDSTYTLQVQDYRASIQVDVIPVAGQGKLRGKMQRAVIGPIMMNPARRGRP